MNSGHDIPTIKVILSIDKFNILMNAIDSVETKRYENLQPYVEKIKNKIMKYGIPRKDSEDNDVVDVRFFAKEINELLLILLPCLDIKNSTDYYNYYLDLDRHNYKKY